MEDSQMTLSEFSKKIRKVFEPRNFKFRDSYGITDAFRYYRKRGGKLDRVQYPTILQAIFKAFADNLAHGIDYKLPYRFGKLCVARSDRNVRFEDGKLKTNLKVDWKETLKLWQESERAYKKRQVIRHETPAIFYIIYDKRGARFRHSYFLLFRTQRSLKAKIKQSVIENNLDALKWRTGQ